MMLCLIIILYKLSCSLMEKRFYLRANIWMPTDNIAWSQEAELYAYGLPHDHSFSFLTVGHFGPGYRTIIYEYDSKKVDGEIGEKVDIYFSEDTTLSNGKVMYFRARNDMHIQFPPKEFSVSINMIPTPRSLCYRPQYIFDVETGRIINYAKSQMPQRLGLIALAEQRGDTHTAEILDRIAATHPCRRTVERALLARDRIIARSE